MTSYFPDGYTLCATLQQNNINLFYEFMDISVLADYKCKTGYVNTFENI